MADHHLYFVSYARNNYNGYMKQFVDELRAAVCERYVHPVDKVDFFDGKSTILGSFFAD